MNIQSLKLAVDANLDGSYSLSELWEAVKFVYYLPGNLVVEGVGHIPHVSSALGIHASQATGYASLNGLLAVTLTLIFWILAVFGILTLCSPTVDEIDDPADSPMSPTQNREYTPEQHETTQAPGHSAIQAASRPHLHLPVSRALYAVPGKKPKRHLRHRSDIKSVAH